MAWRGFFLLLLVHCPSSGHWASPLDFHDSCLYFNSSVIIMCMVWTFSWVWLVTRRMNYYAQVTHFGPLRILGGDRGKTHHYITVHLFVPIQWTFQQVRFIGCPHVSPPHSSGGLMEVENFLLHFVSVRPQSKRAQTDLESQSCRELSKLRSNCLNLWSHWGDMFHFYWQCCFSDWRQGDDMQQVTMCQTWILGQCIVSVYETFQSKQQDLLWFNLLCFVWLNNQMVHFRVLESYVLML